MPLIFCTPYSSAMAAIGYVISKLSGAKLTTKSPGGAFSNDNLTLGCSNSAWNTAYIDKPIAHDSVGYFEVSGNPSTSTYALAGLMRNNVDITSGSLSHYFLPGYPSGLPAGAVAIGVDLGYSNGTGNGFITEAYPNMATADTGLHITTNGDVFGFALDNRVGIKKLYMHKNGVWFGGDGTFETAAAIVSGIPANDFFPAVSTYPGSVININLGTNGFAYTPPAGYA